MDVARSRERNDEQHYGVYQYNITTEDQVKFITSAENIISCIILCSQHKNEYTPPPLRTLITELSPRQAGPDDMRQLFCSAQDQLDLTWRRKGVMRQIRKMTDGYYK